MAVRDADLWHQVHAQREDGVPATFLIRDVEPEADRPQIFVIELPYPITSPSKLPDEASVRRLDTFQDQWVEPACEALGWTFVAWKSEDGSFFLYLYGDGDPTALLDALAPFDGALGFFHDRDPDWSEYAALRELVDRSQAAPEDGGEDGDDDEGENGHVHTDACDHDDDHDRDSTPASIQVIDRTGEPGEPPSARTTNAKAANGLTNAKTAHARATSTPTTNARPPDVKAPRAKRSTAKPAAKRTGAEKPARPRPAARLPAKPPAKKPAAVTSSATKSSKTKPSKTKPSAVRSSAKPRARKSGAKRPRPKRR